MDQHLQVFVTVAERQSFSRAAEHLHMTQPAVSQYIRILEEDIGTKLLERTSKYVRLNRAGEIVYYHAKEILGVYTKMQNLVDDLTNVANGPLNIGASYTFGEYIMPGILAELKKTHPDIQPSLTIGNTAQIAELVSNHQLDVGIVEGHYKNHQLIMEEFAEDEMVIVASPTHELSHHKENIDIARLNQAVWIVREEGSGTREATEKMFEDLWLAPEKQMTFGSTQSIKEAVIAGLGVSLLSQWAIQRELRNGDLRVISFKSLPFTRKFSIITKTSFQTKALEVFIRLLYESVS